MHERAIKVCITDDHPVVIKGLKALLTDRADIKVTGSYLNGEELLNGLDKDSADILLLDIKLPGMGGEELAVVLGSKYPELKIIVLTYLDSVYHTRLMIRQGVKGYVLKTASDTEIIDAIHAVYKGEQYLEKTIKDKILQHALLNKKDSTPALSKREKEILQLMASNYTSQEIADKLFLSKRTVENHRANMLLKLNVKNAVSLVKKAIELDLLG